MSKDRLPPDFPAHLIQAAFFSGDEAAWPIDLTLVAIEWLGVHGFAILGTEFWVLAEGRINSIPKGTSGARGVYGNAVQRRPLEQWTDFVSRSVAETKKYLKTFKTSDIAEQGTQLFNIIWVGEQEFSELTVS